MAAAMRCHYTDVSHFFQYWLHGTGGKFVVLEPGYVTKWYLSHLFNTHAFRDFDYSSLLKESKEMIHHLNSFGDKSTIPTFYIHDERIKQLFINVCNPLEEIKRRLLGMLAVVTENGFRFNFSVDKVEFRNLTEEELARQVAKYQRADGQYVFRGAFLP